MVNQYIPQQLAPPLQAPSPSLSPAQWAQLAQLAQTQQQQQSTSPQQAAPPSTSAYTSSGTMSAIDPALLYQQWMQQQQGQLAQSAIIPQYQPQYSQQYAPTQPAGEFVSTETIAAITDFIEKSKVASGASAQYIAYLQAELATVDRGYAELVQFSGTQDALIERFLFDPVFLLDYLRDAWSGRISDAMMSRFADTYLTIAETSPRGTGLTRNPEFTGNPNPQFTAAVVPQNPAPQPNLIPPLPSSNGSASPYITMEQYLIAQQQGQVAQARAAALQNPAGLYGALFQ